METINAFRESLLEFQKALIKKFLNLKEFLLAWNRKISSFF